MFTLLRYFYFLRPAARLIWRLMRDRRVPLITKFIPVLALAYVVTPIDLIPDFLPIRGQLDDILVVVILLGMFVVMSPWPVVIEHATGRAPMNKGDRGGATREFDGETIETDYRLEDDDVE